MYEIITLADAKSWLNVSGTSKDTFLETLRDVTTRMIEDYTGHPFVTRQYTEYYDGRNETDVLLDHYPVYVELDNSGNVSNITMYDDTDRDWTSSDLIDPDDYVIDPDIGRIRLYNEESSFANGRQNIKVTYWAGYSRFHVVDEQNNYIDITDAGGTAAVEIAENDDQQTTWKGYSAESLASTLQTALNANATLSGTFTVTYSHITQKFTIASTLAFTIDWSTGASSAKSLGTLMGYVTSADDIGGSSYTSDNAVIGLPSDIHMAAGKLIYRLYDESKHGSSTQEQKSKTIAQGGTLAFVKNALPDDVKMILDKYVRCFL